MAQCCSSHGAERLALQPAQPLGAARLAPLCLTEKQDWEKHEFYTAVEGTDSTCTLSFMSVVISAAASVHRVAVYPACTELHPL